MKYFATLFDKNYLSRGIVLYNSLKSTEIDFKMHILCLDDYTYNYFTERKNQYQNLELTLIEELERYDTELLGVKSSRKPVEYYFTMSPCWPLYLLTKFNLPHICTLDADIFFYSSPKNIFDYLNEYSIIITPHKFSPELVNLEKYGKFNVSFQIFKNDEIGFICLNKWRKECLSWCEDKLDTENKRFADQLYLDSWPNDFNNKVKILDDNYSGIAPWNINKYNLINNGRGQLVIDGTPLVYYHFQHFKILNQNYATNGFWLYDVKSTNSLKKLYFNYWNEIRKINTELFLIQDETLRLDLKKKIILTIIEDRKVFVKYFNRLFIFNAKLIPKFIRSLIKKIYA